MAGSSKHIAIKIGNTDEEQSDDNKFKHENLTPAIVFLIDGGKYMFNGSDTLEDLPFLMSVKCIRDVMRKRIFNISACQCSVIIFNAGKTDNLLGVPNLFTVLPLSRINAETVLAIDKLCKHVQDGTYEKEYGSGESSLAESLWLAASTFMAVKAKGRRRVILFTNNDDPFKNADRQERTRTYAKVSDFERSRIWFDLVPIGDNFHYTKCYKELIEMSGCTDVNESTCSTMEAMVKKCNIAGQFHVQMSTLPFYLSENLCIPVAFTKTRRLVKLYKEQLDAATNNVIRSEVVRFSEETGEKVEKEEILVGETIAGVTCTFDADEKKIINDKGEKRIRLLGFKSKSIVSPELHTEPGFFVFPADYRKKEQTKLFAGLVERCLAKNVVAFCTWCPRPTSTVRYAALVPQAEIKDNEGFQVQPPGFILVFLPFGNEVRDWDDTCRGKEIATEEQIDIISKMIKRLTFKFNPELFPDPALANQWAAIEALALDLPERQSTQDMTLPNYEMIQEQLKNLPQRFKDEIYSEGYEIFSDKVRASVKLPVDVGAVENLARSNEVHKLKVEQLKTFLRQVGRSGLTTMKKNDLVAAVYQYFGIET